MAFPFLFLVIPLSCGILFSRYISLPLIFQAFALFLFCSISWVFFLFKKEKISFVFILICSFFLGSGLHSYEEFKYRENSLHKFTHQEYVDFYGDLYRSPGRGQNRYYLYLRVKKVSYKNKEESIEGNLKITVLCSEPGLKPNFFVGDRLKVSARILSQKGFKNFNRFSLDEYLKEEKIHRRAFTKSSLLVTKISSGRPFSLLRLISQIRHYLEEKIELHFGSGENKFLTPQGAILEALILGERGRLEERVTYTLQKSGLYHLFAISGAHIAIISFLVFSFLKFFGVRERPSYLLLMIMLMFYALLVEGRPSVLRATIMALAFLLSKLVSCDVNLINTVSLSAFFILLANPFNLFSLGFQLTFVATLSIILFYPAIMKYLPRLPLRISELFAISVAAQVSTLPFLALSFNRITFSSLILNYAGIPLMGVIMAAGYIFLCLSFIKFYLASKFALGIKFLIDIFLKTTEFANISSFFSYRIPTPHLLTVIGYFLFLLLLLLPPKIRKLKMILLGGFLVTFFLIIVYPFSPSTKDLKVTFIDVGQGDSILIEFPGKKKMLIDGGGLREGGFDVGEKIVSPVLWDKGIKRIDYLVLTHAHPDHLNGLIAIARNFKIKEYWDALTPYQNEVYSELMKLLPLSCPRKKMYKGKEHRVGKVKIEAFHPEKKEFQNRPVSNEDSLVLRMSFENYTFLFTGDIGEESEMKIIKENQNLKSRILKAPHHGSKTSSSGEFLKRVLPEIVVIQVGEGNIYGLPDFETIKRYQQIGTRIYRTDIHGAVEMSSDGTTLRIKTAVKPDAN